MTDPGLMRQYLAGFCASLSMFCCSVAYAWVSPLLVNLQSADSEIPMSSDQISWVVALIELGNVLTPIPSGLVVNFVGRKTLVLLTTPTLLLTWILVLSTRSVEVLCFVRIVQGMCIGFVFTGLPMYLGEIAEPKIRGFLSNYIGIMWNLGILYAYSIGPYVSYQTWTLFCLAPTLIHLGTFVWFPKSPYYLLLRGQGSEAAKSLAWFRCKTREEVSDELNAMKESVYKEQENKASWKDVVCKPVERRALGILQLFAVLKILTGAYVLQSYASDTLQQVTGPSFVTPDLGSILMCVCTLLVTFVSGFVVDLWGRRPLLLISCIGTTVCSFGAFVYYLLEIETSWDVQSYTWVPYLSVILSCSMISLGVWTVSTTMRSELFPNTTRGIALGITSTHLTFLSFVTLKMHKVIADNVGLYLDFLIYSSVGFIGTILVYFVVPETKGKTFDEIQKMLHKQ